MKKRKYEPPSITSPEFSNKLGLGSSPAGITGCGPGPTGGACQTGNDPQGSPSKCNQGNDPNTPDCHNGTSAKNLCTNGTDAVVDCLTGTSVPGDCMNGITPGGPTCNTGTSASTCTTGIGGAA